MFIDKKLALKNDIFSKLMGLHFGENQYIKFTDNLQIFAMLLGYSCKYHLFLQEPIDFVFVFHKNLSVESCVFFIFDIAFWQINCKESPIFR